MGYVITIDGPAASGKSSLSRELSKKVGCPWVSTGAFYRGLAYAAMQLNLDLNDAAGLSELCSSDIWSVVLSYERTHVFFKNENVTDKIAQESVGNVASRISHYPEVRQSLLDHQRSFALSNKGLIAEGRDCGTVVFPLAEVKVYLTADSENRAHRRAQELGMDEKTLVQQQEIRDKQDSTRKVAPLQIPIDALVVDTTHLDLDGVVELVEKHVRSKIQL
ncbi:MAG: (d)CMP kinase [Pseudobdellovibrio sp.]